MSVVVPVYNEQQGLAEFHRELSVVLDDLDLGSEIVFVDDGSHDGSEEVLRRLHKTDPRVALVRLSRNFGKEIALTAGLDHARGEAVVVIDADLQDPPQLIPKLIERWREGYDVVYAQRQSRTGETFFKRASAAAFYWLMQRVGRRVHIPTNTGDFRLLSRRALDALLELREQHRFMKGLFTWIGFPQCAVRYDRNPRYVGKSKWNYWSLLDLSIEGITSFTTMPLKLATFIGGVTALFAFVYGMFIIANTLIYGNPVPGYPSLMAVVLLLGGVQLMTVGILGEYIGRIFNETKRRPLYFVAEFLPGGGSDEPANTARDDESGEEA